MKAWLSRLVRYHAAVWITAVSGVATPSALVRTISNSPLESDVVVVAHQDDWQLFMGDVVTERLRTGHRGLFVYVTAGDDGRDSLYWQTRERAALQSVRVAVGIPTADSTNCSIVGIRTHSIRECVVGNTVSYFFRLPDGNRNGKGFARNRYESLRKLRSREISEISAIDGSTTYRGWPDVLATVGALIERDSTRVTVHTTDPSIARNPHDHFDHRSTGLLVADLLKEKDFGAMYYVGYALASRAPNRSTAQMQVKTALFLAYDREMIAVNRQWSAYREHPAFYAECLERTYARSPVPVIR